jgi:UPF0042 nucleotide-binding protein
MQVILSSFGYKHGMPDAETILDVRFLPNPYYVPELKEGTGLEARVADYVLCSDAARAFLVKFVPFFLQFLQSHAAAGRLEVRLAVGCTGGRHRSVAFVEEMKKILASHRFATQIVHRDKDKE